ncbi:hypothetical protein [Nocardioides sp. AE5]|uniref:hypothetical protein n=1 Tax=Nocardioides sp. AE5 TaxID=2962573 RepID=UPI002880CBE2|nr:hypothetical protein [Nocardioides sp. AE5]MDT0202537.1 hypothetical protein [Nocardioides sp. AE5]
MNQTPHLHPAPGHPSPSRPGSGSGFGPGWVVAAWMATAAVVAVLALSGYLVWDTIDFIESTGPEDDASLAGVGFIVAGIFAIPAILAGALLVASVLARNAVTARKVLVALGATIIGLEAMLLAPNLVLLPGF